MEQLTVGQQFWKKGYRKSLTQFRNFEPKNIHQKFQRIIYNPTLTEGEKIFSRFLTFVDLFWTQNAFFEKLISRASFWGIICPLLAMSEIWPHIPPNAPEWPQGFFSNYKKIFWQNWVFWRLIEKKIIMSWITLDFFKNKTMCYSRCHISGQGSNFRKSCWPFWRALKVRPAAKFAKISGHRGSRNPKETADGEVRKLQYQRTVFWSTGFQRSCRTQFRYKRKNIFL